MRSGRCRWRFRCSRRTAKSSTKCSLITILHGFQGPMPRSRLWEYAPRGRWRWALACPLGGRAFRRLSGPPHYRTTAVDAGPGGRGRSRGIRGLHRLCNRCAARSSTSCASSSCASWGGFGDASRRGGGVAGAGRGTLCSLPGHALLLTIGAGATEVGESFSPAVIACLPQACEILDDTIRRLLAPSG